MEKIITAYEKPNKDFINCYRWQIPEIDDHLPICRDFIYIISEVYFLTIEYSYIRMELEANKRVDKVKNYLESKGYKLNWVSTNDTHFLFTIEGIESIHDIVNFVEYPKRILLIATERVNPDKDSDIIKYSIEFPELDLPLDEKDYIISYHKGSRKTLMINYSDRDISDARAIVKQIRNYLYNMGIFFDNYDINQSEWEYFPIPNDLIEYKMLDQI